jgi:hypothetical protein
MDRSPAAINQEFDTTPDRIPRADWLDASIASGFIATFAMTVCTAAAYGIVNAVGDTNGNRLERWFAALTNNELTESVGDGFAVGLILNLVMGVVWAMIYAWLFAPRLPGPGWRRGALFSLIPWFLSLVVFFPIAGIGFFGSEVNAGILPAAGNLVLHLVYGVVLGSLYRVREINGDEEPIVRVTGERATSIGLVAGGILGYIGGWFLGPSIDNLASQPVVAFAGALTGAAMGMLMGSLLGVGLDEDTHTH